MTKVNKEKELSLTLTRLKEVLEYNPLSGKFTALINRSNIKKGQVVGYLHKSTGYIKISIDGHQHSAHRLAWLYTYGEFPQGELSCFIDHINGNKVDNRIENLKISSARENQRNKQMNPRNTSGINGVSRAKIVTSCRGREYLYCYWVAGWHNEDSQQRQKWFPVHKLGEEGAKQAAIDYRAEQVHLLKLNHGIIYSERHGT